MMLSGANLLIFDEPTNHLDVESIEALEDAIEDYDGTVLLVSHDRALLRALTTRTWVLHDARITDYPGRLRGMGGGERRAGPRRGGRGGRGGGAPQGAGAEADPPPRRRPPPSPVGCAAPRNGPWPTRRPASGCTEASGGRAAGAAGEPATCTSRPTAPPRPRGIGAELDAARQALDLAFAEWEAATRRMETAG